MRMSACAMRRLIYVFVVRIYDITRLSYSATLFFHHMLQRNSKDIRPTPARADKPCVACKQSLLRYKLSQLFYQYTIGHYVTERGLH